MNEALKSTNFKFPGQTGFYSGKVRDVYFLGDKLIMIATDRISAFDVILPQPIPYKGAILNTIASDFLKATRDIVPNWLESNPDPNVSVGKKCEPFKIEMVIRGYLAGHAWREYRDGKRDLCGVPLPDGLKENDPLPEPIITPTTKADEGHDMDISRDEILKQGIVSEKDYVQLEEKTRALFEFGSNKARGQGLILVDTKYEFGKFNDQIFLIDEVHTPDSSRYFYRDGYEERQANGDKQKQLSKEFVRQWLIQNGFQGQEGQKVPEMTPEVVKSISDRYIELFEKVTGRPFERPDNRDIEKRIQENVLKALK
ncbi:MAG TPA: phosphoribosylaminoimidazolesuccinocarboxamide synthase [Cytophagales bacterium]|jgi:phosphoribosylaminoimidazole-succinocarboxamide synthase|nr:phosphoribosylaminoimidazolesuccinocarboxamide synthase [Cytophagales bacterium]